METGEYRRVGGKCVKMDEGLPYSYTNEDNYKRCSIGMKGSLEWGPAGLSAGTGDVHDIPKRHDGKS